MIFYSIVSSAQALSLPRLPYKIIIGKDTFETSSEIERTPQYGWQTIADSFRINTYLFKGEKSEICYPKRIDTSYGIDLFDPYKADTIIDTSDHISLNRMIDTISVRQLKELLSEEIEVYEGDIKLKLNGFGILIISKDGRSFSFNYDQKRMAGNDPLILKTMKRLSFPFYLIMRDITFYDNKIFRQTLGRIGWKIE